MSADAAHMTEGSSGTFFALVGHTANNNIAIVAAAFMLEGEAQGTWEKFFNFVRETSPGIDVDTNTVIMDGDKGGRAAFDKSFDHAGFFSCSKHRKDKLATCKLVW